MSENPYQSPAEVEPRAVSKPKDRVLSGLACLTLVGLIVFLGLLAVAVTFVVALSFSDM